MAAHDANRWRGVTEAKLAETSRLVYASLVMWNLIRCLVVTLALVGLVGQTTVRAMPMAVAVPSETPVASLDMASAAMNCADMLGMSDIGEAAAPQSPVKSPCKGMTPDCMGKMGCATLVIAGPTSHGLAAPIGYVSLTFTDPDRKRQGVAVGRPFHPPRPLA